MAQSVGSHSVVPGGPHFSPSISDSHSWERHLNLNYSQPQRPEGSQGDIQHFNQRLFPVRHFFTRRPYEALAPPLPWDGVSYASTSCDTVTVECLYGLCISVGAPCSSGVGLLQPPVGTVTEVEANTALAYRAFGKGMFHSYCRSCYNLW